MLLNHLVLANKIIVSQSVELEQQNPAVQFQTTTNSVFTSSKKDEAITNLFKHVTGLLRYKNLMGPLGVI